MPANAEVIPSAIVTAQEPQIHSGIPVVDNTVNRLIEKTMPAADPVASVNLVQVALTISVYIWLCGMAVLVLYAVIGYVQLNVVENEAQLRAIGTGQYGLDKNHMQNANITMSKDEWEPIGTESNPFTGRYNGNGFEIIGLTMTSSTIKTIGFFGYANDASLYNITLRPRH